MKKIDLLREMKEARLLSDAWLIEGEMPQKFNWKYLDSASRDNKTNQRLDHNFYMFYYASLLPERSLILEVGMGMSTLCMGMAIKGKGSLIITVDPGLWSEEERLKRKDYLSQYDIHNPQGYLNDIKNLNLDGYIVPVPDTSENVLKRWDGRQIDLLFVDGDHKPNGVRIDCEWMKYVKVGGIAVFDDWDYNLSTTVKNFLADKPEWEMVTDSTLQTERGKWKTVYWRNQ